MLRALGIAPEAIPIYHFAAPPSSEDIAKVAAMDVLTSPRIKASCASLATIAARTPPASGGAGRHVSDRSP